METRTALAISGTAHAGMVVWALIGGLFQPVDDDDSVSVAQVSVISASEFDALVSAPPDSIEPPTPTLLTPPDVAESAPAPAPPVDAAPPTARPDAPDPTPQEVEPDVSQIEPLPRAEVAEETPDPLTTPADAPDAPPSDTPAPRDAPRVADTPAPAPPPMVDSAPVEQQPPTPSPDPAEPPEEVATAPAAPEEATPIIVPEESTPGAAPETSTRPGRRPSRPEPVVVASETSTDDAPTDAPATPPAEEEDPLAAAIAGAVSEANSDPAPAPAAPAGPPLTQGERDGLRVAVSRCWNVGSLSTEALRTRVTISLEVNRDGTPLTNTIELTGFDGGSQASANQAFEAGRRAIIRCGSDGFDLPAEKYEQWREIEMTFDPEQMRSR